MSVLKNRIELVFEDFTRNIYRHRILYLIGMFAVIFLMCSSVLRLTVDTATESMLHKNDSSLLAYNDYRDQFGRTDIITVLVEAPDLFDIDFLRKLEKLHNEIKLEAPHLNKVRSLISIRDTNEKEGTLYVDDLMKDFENRNMAEIKKRALENPFYRNYILSSDKKSTAIMLETVAIVQDSSEVVGNVGDDFDDDDGMSDMGDGKESSSEGTWHYITADEKAEVNEAVKGIIIKYQADDFRLVFSGGPVVVDVFNKTTASDTKRLMKIMTVVIIVFLFLLFRRISGVLMPMIIVNASMLSTLGLMAYTNTPISLMTNLLPGFLVAVGIADAVHVLTIFYRKFDEGESKEDAICYAMGHSGIAILMTSVTTAAGLLSFSIAEIATISDMGYFAAAGVILALLFTIILLPALIAVTPIVRKGEVEADDKPGYMDRVLLKFAQISINYPKQIIAVSILFFIVSVFYICQLNFSSYVLAYFPDDHPVKIDLKYMESKFEGSVAFEVVIDTGKENGLYDPEILNSIERLTEKLYQIKTDTIYIGKIVSINDIVKETNQALHEN